MRFEYLRNNIAFFGMKGLDDSKRKQLLHLRRAIVEHKIVRLTYVKRFAEDSETETTRDIAPYSLASLEHDWYVMAHCYLRQDVRVFRLSRIDQLEILDTSFERPRNFVPD
jgi:predicted DNA-binding transcriptional regulator YafY